MRKKLLGCLFAGCLLAGSAFADVVVRVAPPRALVERRGPAPGRDYVWINGYHRWVHCNGGWVFEEGRWR